MRALQLLDNRSLKAVDLADPPPPAEGEVQVRIGAVALNHIDVWGWRGMAFAKRKLPIVVGAEAAGEIVAIGPGVAGRSAGDIVALYGAETCGVCAACRAGRDNFCENVAGIRGFHVDGLARERVNIAARLAIKAPAGIDAIAAACAPITYGTVEHMLFDNAHLEAGQTVLIQAGGSGIGTAAIQLAKAVGATVITTVSTDEKAAKAKALGADHVINYREERFEGVVRKLTQKARRRRRLRACRPGHLPGEHVLPEARRHPRHLRLDHRRLDRDQPLPALSAAAAPDRLVRLQSPQSRHRPRQDGGRHRAARD